MNLLLPSWRVSRHNPAQPGLSLTPRELASDVVSCAEAASGKGIPLANELKTLVLTTSKGLRALHLRGDRSASLRKVKNFLAVDEARIAPPYVIAGLGLMPGTVCPLL